MGFPHTVKRCSECRQHKPLDNFYPKDAYCKSCRQKRDLIRSSRYVARVKAIDPLHFRRKKLLALYGISQESYERKVKTQDGCCAMCGKPETRILYGEIPKLVIDHDHQTGELRQLLCCRCNAALGVIENWSLLAKALRYLSNHSDEWQFLDDAISYWIENGEAPL